ELVDGVQRIGMTRRARQRVEQPGAAHGVARGAVGQRHRQGETAVRVDVGVREIGDGFGVRGVGVILAVGGEGAIAEERCLARTRRADVAAALHVYDYVGERQEVGD